MPRKEKEKKKKKILVEILAGVANLGSRIGRSENPVRLSRVPDWSQLSSQLWCPASAPESVVRHALSASDIVTGCAPYSQPQPRKRKASADRRAPFFPFLVLEFWPWNWNSETVELEQ